jgi:ATP-dependent Clp protease ATP-binding subunit ClpA
MFDRYTEKARRVIFFARYEASMYGQPYIETEHVLLGLLREDKALFHRLTKLSFQVQSIRDQVSAATPIREKVSTSVDLPLSNECKRVLAYAAEESQRMADRHIGSEHLFLGLLRETNGFAAALLRERGITLEKFRDIVKQDRVGEPEAQTLKTSSADADIEIHGIRRSSRDVLPRVVELRTFHWEKAHWKTRDILVHKQDKRIWFYHGQQYDAAAWELKKGGWKQDHCRICDWELFESPDPAYGTGYTNGREWICSECQEKFMPPFTPAPEDYT